MKGHAAASALAPPGKRRWKGPPLLVPALVILSLLVPLAFLLGLHNRFPAGISTDDQQATESSFQTFVRVEGRGELGEGDELSLDDVTGKLEQTISKVATDNIMRQADEGFSKKTVMHDRTSFYETKDYSHNFKGLTSFELAASNSLPLSNMRVGGVETGGHVQGLNSDEIVKSCQLLFGSYCLWSIEHKEVMKDSMVKRLKDQLFVARAYYPSIAKLQGQEKLSRELKQNIQEFEHMLSEAISDADLPLFVESSIQKMDQTIAKAKSCSVGCNNFNKKLGQIVDLTEDEAHFHMRQSAFLYRLGVQTMHKSLHCLSMRLTVEYFKSASVDPDHRHAHTQDSPGFRHYVIFSRSILAASVVINSTVMNSEETEDMVFHLLTDEQNYYAMKLFFIRNSYKKAAIKVLNFDQLNNEYNMGLAQLSLPEEFRIFIHDIDQPPPVRTRMEYISTFGHSHFLLPEMFKELKKVVVLDDDVVVQQDLSPLWNLDLEGKVNGAVEFCGVRLSQLRSYLGENSYDGKSCLWMSGLNVIDLEKWREHNVTGIYREVLQKLQSRSEASWRAAALPASLLAFQDLIYPLDSSWALSGLGHDYGVSEESIKNSAALHYNGNMKPWLDLGIPKYKEFWKKYLIKEERFVDDCNVNR